MFNRTDLKSFQQRFIRDCGNVSSVLTWAYENKAEKMSACPTNPVLKLKAENIALQS